MRDRITNRAIRAGGTLLVLVACGLTAPRAYAQSDADRENAQALYKAGNDARDAGDMKAAAGKYKVAYALVQTPVIALALGKAQLATGQLIEARQTLLSVDRLPVKPNESALTTAARAEASSLATPIEGRIPTVTLKIARPAGSAAPTVTIDGATIPEVALDVPRKVNPGHHVVVATNGTDKAEVPFDIAEGTTREIPLAPGGAAAPIPAAVAVVAPVPVPVPAGGVAPPPVAGEPAPVAAAPTSSSSGPSHVPAYVSLGVGVAGVGVTAAFGILALGNQSTLKGECGTSGNGCPASAQSTVSSLKTNALISDIGLGVAIAGVGLGTVLLIVQRGGGSASPTAQRSISPWLGFGSGGVNGTF